MTETEEYTILPTHFSIKSQVINGDKIGRTIGFPTANLKLDGQEIDLKPGVYLCQLAFENQPELQKYGLTYYGPRYIFGELTNSFETYIYNFNQEIYGSELVVTVSDFMRPPLKIKSLAELKNQLEKDKAKGLELLTTRGADL